MVNQLGTQRLFRHRVMGEQCTSADAVTRWMGAMQAQDYKQSLWAIGARLADATVADIEQAIADGKIVRTWSQRGTIHFIPADDILWMLDLCASRILSGHGRRMKQLELTDDIMAQCADLVREAMDDGAHKSRADIMQLCDNAGISTAGQRGYHILWHLAHQGLICITTQEGREQSFALVEKWIPNARQLSRDEALAELVLRFFQSHSPATDYDFAKWSGLTLTDTRKGLAMNEKNLESYQHNDMTHWFAGDVPELESSVCLLPAFDEFLLGYKDRDDILEPEHADKVCPGGNGVFQPMIVVDGQIVGVWKRKLKAKSIDIELLPFTTLGDARDVVITEAERYGQFMGLPINIIEG